MLTFEISLLLFFYKSLNSALTLKPTWLSVSSGPSTSMMGVSWSRPISWIVAPSTQRSVLSASRCSIASSDGLKTLANVSKALHTHVVIDLMLQFENGVQQNRVQSFPCELRNCSDRVMSLADCSSCWLSEVLPLLRFSLSESLRLASDVTTLANVPRSLCPDSICK